MSTPKRDRGSAKKGTRGQPKTPTAMLKISGAGNDKRRESKFQEPQPEICMPLIPHDVQDVMNQDARDHWDAVTPILYRIGVLADIDAFEIARYCIIFSRWLEAERYLGKNGLTYDYINSNDETHYKPYPEAALAIKYSDQLLKIEGQFGMSASARASVDVAKTTAVKNSEAADYMNETNVS